MEVMDRVKSTTYMLVVYLYFSTTLFAPFVLGDQHYVDQICQSVKPFQDLCLKCMKSNPGSPTFNIKQLANQAIFCAYYQANMELDSYRKNAKRESNKILQKAYNDCASIIDQQVAEQITLSLSKFGDGDYRASIQLLVDATQGCVNCRDLIKPAFQQVRLSVPVEIAVGLQRTQDLIKVAQGVEHIVISPTADPLS